jgi:hypothetical protein
MHPGLSTLEFVPELALPGKGKENDQDAKDKQQDLVYPGIMIPYVINEAFHLLF